MERDIYGQAAGVFPGRNNGQFNANPMPTAYPPAPPAYGTASEVAPRRTVVHVVAEAHARVEDLVQRVEQLASRLVGPWPIDAPKDSSGRGPSLTGALWDSADEVNRLVTRGNEALDRIFSELP